MFRGIRKRVTAVVGTALVCAMFASCSPPADSGSGTNNGGGTQTGGTTPGGGSGGTKTVTAWLQAKPDSMSPLMGANYGNGAVFEITQDRLALVDADGKLQPRAASKWEVDPGGKKITFTLADQKWSDGQPFTADDVVWTATTIANKKSATPVASDLRGIVGYQDLMDGKSDTFPGVKAIDDKTVEFTLDEVDAGALYRISNMFILPKHTLESIPLDKVATAPEWAEPGKVPGLGPFVLSANLPGQRVELTKNPNFRTPAKFDKLVQVLVGQDVATQQLASGEMDITLVAPTDLPSLESMKNIKRVEALSAGYDRYAFNQRTEDRFKDARVRQAFIYAIDRKGILASIYQGQSKPWNSSFTAGSVDYSTLETYDYNPEKAKQLLQEANFDFSKPVVIRQQVGNEQRAAVHQVVAKNLQAIGVKAEIKPIDPAAIMDMFQNGDYDMFLYGGGNYLSTPLVNEPMLVCGGTANNGKFCDKDIDALFAKAAGMTDETARKDIEQQLVELDNKLVSHLWIGRPNRVYATSDKLTGGVVAGDGMANTYASIQDWEVKG